jgi:hypothetical protein
VSHRRGPLLLWELPFTKHAPHPHTHTHTHTHTPHIPHTTHIHTHTTHTAYHTHHIPHTHTHTHTHTTLTHDTLPYHLDTFAMSHDTITEKVLGDLLGQLENQHNDKDRIRLIEAAADGHWFTTVRMRGVESERQWRARELGEGWAR